MNTIHLLRDRINMDFLTREMVSLFFDLFVSRTYPDQWNVYTKQSFMDHYLNLLLIETRDVDDTLQPIVLALLDIIEVHRAIKGILEDFDYDWAIRLREMMNKVNMRVERVNHLHSLRRYPHHISKNRGGGT